MVRRRGEHCHEHHDHRTRDCRAVARGRTARHQAHRRTRPDRAVGGLSAARRRTCAALWLELRGRVARLLGAGHGAAAGHRAAPGAKPPGAAAAGTSGRGAAALLPAGRAGAACLERGRPAFRLDAPRGGGRAYPVAAAAGPRRRDPGNHPSRAGSRPASAHPLPQSQPAGQAGSRGQPAGAWCTADRWLIWSPPSRPTTIRASWHYTGFARPS